MSSKMIAFLPWFSIVEKTKIGNYTLYPFEFNSPNDPDISSLENDIKNILANYLDSPHSSVAEREFPTKKVTVLKKDNKRFGDSYSEKEMDELFIFQYVLGVAALANREFLNSDFYLCSENMNIIVQKYDSPLTGAFSPFITSKRKRGNDATGFSAGMFREVKPWSIPTQKIAANKEYRLKFDAALANALWSIKKDRSYQKIWANHIYPSIFSFFMANTDGFADQLECIYSESCIEKLILGSKHTEKDLLIGFRDLVAGANIEQEKFSSTNRNWKDIKVSTEEIESFIPKCLLAPIIAKNKYVKKINTKKKIKQISLDNIVEAWLIELKRLRNVYAHGGVQSHSSDVWTVKEHLMYSSFVYPLLLKMFISQKLDKISYKLNANDTNKIKVLSQLAAADDITKVDIQNDTEWDTVIKNSRWI